MQHGDDADAGAEVLRVGGNGGHRLGRGLEQQTVEGGLVLERNVGDLGGQCEHDVEVADREEVGLALGQPGARGRALAARAVPVPAGVVGDPPVPAAGAGLDVTTHDGGAAVFDGRHDLELVEAEVASAGGPIRRTGSAEDVGDLE